MGFFGSLFAHAAVGIARDMKKQEKEHQDWNRLFDEMQDAEIEFSNFLRNKGIDAVYVSDVKILDGGQTAVNAEKRKLEGYKRSINEYISLGGHASNIGYDYENMDDLIRKIKYLKSVNYLAQQDEWMAVDFDTMKTLIDMTIEADAMGQEIQSLQAEMERKARVCILRVIFQQLSGHKTAPFRLS